MLPHLLPLYFPGEPILFLPPLHVCMYCEISSATTTYSLVLLLPPYSLLYYATFPATSTNSSALYQSCCLCKFFLTMLPPLPLLHILLLYTNSPATSTYQLSCHYDTILPLSRHYYTNSPAITDSSALYHFSCHLCKFFGAMLLPLPLLQIFLLHIKFPVTTTYPYVYTTIPVTYVHSCPLCHFTCYNCTHLSNTHVFFARHSIFAALNHNSSGTRIKHSCGAYSGATT